MSRPVSDPHADFAERLRIQVQSRYRDVAVAVDGPRFALHLTGSGIDAQLPLAPLAQACDREPARTSTLIGDFVRSVERQMTPHAGTEFALARLLWCVRTRGYLDSLNRRDDLLLRELGGDLVGFVAETLPGSWMRGVPRDAWSADHQTTQVITAADQNTEARFAHLVARIAATDRVPADGWRLSSDVLFQGSVLLAQSVLQAFVTRAGCDVLVANPDRSVLLVLPVNASAADSFAMRAVREWRESMNPQSRDVLISNGKTTTAVTRKRSRLELLPWLSQ